MSGEGEDEDYFLAPQNQRVFGAGIKHKEIAFVPASSQDPSIGQKPPQISNIGDLYLSIVSGKDSPKTTLQDGHDKDESRLKCAVCNQILSVGDKIATNAHEASIAHQFCLTHSHPPSHLDRDHVGVKYLSSYGWDPDSRSGLGAHQDGIRMPVKAKQKNDTAGLKAAIDDDDAASTRKRAASKRKESPVIKLDAKQVRIKDLEARKRAERLRQSFYGQDLTSYLGPEG